MVYILEIENGLKITETIGGDVVVRYLTTFGFPFIRSTNELGATYQVVDTVGEIYNLPTVPSDFTLENINGNVYLSVTGDELIENSLNLKPFRRENLEDRVISLGTIVTTSSAVTVNLPSSGINSILINGNTREKYIKSQFTFTPVTTGIKVLIIYGLDTAEMLYLSEGTEGVEAVEPSIPTGALFVARVIVSSTGTIIEEEDFGYKFKADDAWRQFTIGATPLIVSIGSSNASSFEFLTTEASPVFGGILTKLGKNTWDGKRYYLKNSSDKDIALEPTVIPEVGQAKAFTFAESYVLKKESWAIIDIVNGAFEMMEFGGGTSDTIAKTISVTKTELDTHITNSTLVAGVIYGITEAERWMLLGDSTDTLYLRAISANQLETKGMGKFFVPKYNQTIDGYGIWQGEVYQVFPTTVPEPNYGIDDEVIWGGRLWINVSGNLGTKIDIYNLSSDWEVIPFNETDYNVRFDKIEYDYQNDTVIYRKDDNGNEISTSYQDWLIKEDNYFDGNPLNISFSNSLKIYQWGNEFDYNSFKGCGFNIVTNSILECLNICGRISSNTLNNGQITFNTLNNGQIYSNTLNNGQIASNTLENNGEIAYNTLDNGRIYSNTLDNGQIYSNTLENNGYIYANTLENNGRIYSNTLNNGQITFNTLENNGYIYFNTLENSGQIRLGLANTINNKTIRLLTINNGDIGGDSGIDLSLATLVYANYTREVFKNSAGVTKIKYVDGTGATIIADLTD